MNIHHDATYCAVITAPVAPIAQIDGSDKKLVSTAYATKTETTVAKGCTFKCCFTYLMFYESFVLLLDLLY